MQDQLNYNECYDILGLKNSNLSWELIRHAYRKQSQKWHPDKAKQNNTDTTLAEEKFKLINLAYKRLQHYYDKFGVLPDTNPQPAARFSSAQTNFTASDGDDTTEYRSAFVFSSIVILALVAMLLSLVLVFSSEDEYEHTTIQDVSDNDRAKPATDIPPNPAATASAVPSAKRVFSYGSSMGEVIEAQGRPDVIDGTTWWYGESKVVFVDGNVTEWKVDESSPLNVTIRPNANYQLTMHTNKPPKKLLSIGLSKNEVLEIQGKPSTQSIDIWVYGLSKVYFKNNKVISWYSSPLDPLKVRN